MPQTQFCASQRAADELFAFVFSETDCRIYETYSNFDADLRQLKSIDDLHTTRSTPAVSQLSLWSPTIMPPPVIERIELKDRRHSFRHTVRGCGLFTILLGDAKTPSAISYWSEAGARARCTVVPGPETVNWPAHKKLGARLIRRAKSLSREP